MMSRFVFASVGVLLFLGCGSPELLKVGTMPAIDSVPLSLANYRPIFAENRLAVKVVHFHNPSELRDALVNGRVDAIITDLAAAFLVNERGETGKIVRVSLKSSRDRPMFAIVAAPRQPTALRSLENARIALSREAMDGYVADRLLASAGIRTWKPVEVASPEAALELMEKAGAPAALLSEPFISMALKRGGRVILDDRNMLLGQTVIIFSGRMVEKKPALIRRFLRAYEQSVREWNTRPHLYLSPATDPVRVAFGAGTGMPVPVFPFPAEVPTESDIESVRTWLLEKRIISRPISYNRIVHSGFLWDPSQFRPASCCGW